MHLSEALGRGGFCFIALLLGAGDLGLERFDRRGRVAQFGLNAVQLDLPLFVALTRFGSKDFFLLLRFLGEAGFDGFDTGLGLFFPFLLAHAEVVGQLLLQLDLAGLGFDGQFLFALLELGLEVRLLD